jgi:hypothetical protein
VVEHLPSKCSNLIIARGKEKESRGTVLVWHEEAVGAELS